jgi:hypothetical protein
MQAQMMVIRTSVEDQRSMGTVSYTYSACEERDWSS